MRRTLLLLAVSLGVALCVLLLQRGRDGDASPLAPLNARGASERPSGALPARDSAGSTRTASAQPEAAMAAAIETKPVVLLVRDGAGVPTAVELELQLESIYEQALLESPARVDADGRARVDWPVLTRRIVISGESLEVLPPSTLEPDPKPIERVTLYADELEPEQAAPSELRMKMERWVIRAKVHDSTGRLLAGARLRVQPSRLGAARPFLVRTGPAGELVLAVWVQSAHLGEFTTLGLELESEPESSGREERTTVALQLMEAPTRGRLALDVTLNAHDRLVSGRFVDPEGSPENGKLFLEQLVTDSAAPRWELYPCQANMNGSRFDLRGALPSGPLRLVPSFGGCGRAPIAFEVGTTDLEVVIESYGELRGRVLLDAGVEHKHLELVLRRRGERETLVRARWEQELGFYASELEPGSWDLEVLACGQTLARVDAITIAGALPSFDPRLAPLDLRGTLRALTLRIVDEQGALARAARVLAVDESGRKHELGRKAELRVWHVAPLDLLVSAAGRRELLLRGVDEDRTVELGPGLELELTPVGLPELHAEPDWQIALWPAGVETGARNQQRVGVGLDEDGIARLSVDAPGAWEVELRYMRHGQWTAFSHGALIGRVEVRDTSGVQRFRLQIPAEFLQRAGTGR